MKAKRRQELKTNDLAQALEELRESFRRWGAYIVGGLAVVVVMAVVAAYMNSARAEATHRAYADLREVTLAGIGENKSPEEIAAALKKIDELAAKIKNDDFRVDALLKQGEMALYWAQSSEGGIDGKYLDDARRCFQEMLAKYPNHPLHRGRALYGIFQVEANAFALDGDMKHREVAVQHLETIRDDPQLGPTPFGKLAADQLNAADRVFALLEFPNRPEPVAPATPPIEIKPVQALPLAPQSEGQTEAQAPEEVLASPMYPLPEEEGDAAPEDDSSASDRSQSPAEEGDQPPDAAPDAGESPSETPPSESDESEANTTAPGDEDAGAEQVDPEAG